MSNLRVVAIVNPKAAGGAVIRRWPLFEKAIASFVDLDTLLTKRPKHATDLAREAAAGADVVVAVGGDGTINEVINGLLQKDGLCAKLAYIPMGTGGDFQRTVNLPNQPDEAAEVIVSGETLTIDAAVASLISHEGKPVERYFLNMTSFGMGGDVSVKAKNFLSRLSGKLAFLWATFTVALDYRGKTVRIQLDSDPAEHEFFITNLAVGNGRYHGGGMHPCPLALLNDGVLEVTPIERLNLFELVRDIRILYSDNVYQHRKAHHFRARTMRAESDEIVRVEVDGESVGRLPMTITTLPQALRLLIPQSSPLLAEPPATAEPLGQDS